MPSSQNSFSRQQRLVLSCFMPLITWRSRRKLAVGRQLECAQYADRFVLHAEILASVAQNRKTSAFFGAKRDAFSAYTRALLI